MARVIAVPYGWEDPRNHIRPWLRTYPAACWCWCGEVNGLHLHDGRFFCILHLP